MLQAKNLLKSIIFISALVAFIPTSQSSEGCGCFPFNLFGKKKSKTPKVVEVPKRKQLGSHVPEEIPLDNITKPVELGTPKKKRVLLGSERPPEVLIPVDDSVKSKSSKKSKKVKKGEITPPPTVVVVKKENTLSEFDPQNIAKLYGSGTVVQSSSFNTTQQQPPLVVPKKGGLIEKK